MKKMLFNYHELAEMFLRGNAEEVKRDLKNGTPEDIVEVRKIIVKYRSEEAGKVFDRSFLKTSRSIPWYVMILLSFVPSSVSMEGSYYVKTKKLFGKTYVIDSFI